MTRTSAGFRYWIFQRADRPGRWILEWKERVRGGWRTRTATFDTKAEAQTEADRLDVAARQAAGLGDDVVLQVYATKWLERIEPHLRPGTMYNYRWAIDNHVLPWRGEAWLRDIRPGEVKDFLSSKVRGGLAKKTVSNIRNTFHALLEEAVADGHLATNPASFKGKSKALKLSPTRAERRAKVKAFTAEQLGKFLAAEVPSVAAPRRLLFRTSVFAGGLRLGEAAALMWDDFDYVEHTALIRRGYTRSEIQPTKTSEEATVDLPEDLVERLKAHDKETKAAAMRRGEPRSPYVFPSSSGGPIDHNYLERDFKAILKAAGLPGHFTPHCLRHTFATQQLVRGVSIYYVQKQLRHATIGQTVDLYGSWLPAGNREHADAFEEAVTGRKGAPKGSVTRQASDRKMTGRKGR